MAALHGREIKKYIRFLSQSLPSKPTAIQDLYSLPKVLDHAFNSTTKQKEMALQKISDHMGNYLGLLNPVKIRFIDKYEGGIKKNFYVDIEGNASTEEKKRTFIEETNYAGLYRVLGPRQKEIIVVYDKSFYLANFLSVLAHEVTHNYLFHHNIHPPESINNEILTDLAAIYLGFGPILLRGYSPREEMLVGYVGPDIMGYITPHTIRKALLVSYIHREWRYKDIIHKFGWFEKNRYYLALFLLPLSMRKIFKRKIDKDVTSKISKTIIPCQNCSKRLRVPMSNKLYKVVCPSCSFEFQVKDGVILAD